jgi:hypothetical protein
MRKEDQKIGRRMTEGANDQRFFSPEPIGQGTGGDFGEDFGKIIKTLKNHYLGEGQTPLLVEQNHDGYMEQSKLSQPIPVELEDILLHLLLGQLNNELYFLGFRFRRLRFRFAPLTTSR